MRNDAKGSLRSRLGKGERRLDVVEFVEIASARIGEFSSNRVRKKSRTVDGGMIL